MLSVSILFLFLCNLSYCVAQKCQTHMFQRLFTLKKAKAGFKKVSFQNKNKKQQKKVQKMSNVQKSKQILQQDNKINTTQNEQINKQVCINKQIKIPILEQNSIKNKQQDNKKQIGNCFSLNQMQKSILSWAFIKKTLQNIKLLSQNVINHLYPSPVLCLHIPLFYEMTKSLSDFNNTIDQVREYFAQVKQHKFVYVSRQLKQLANKCEQKYQIHMKINKKIQHLSFQSDSDLQKQKKIASNCYFGDQIRCSYYGLLRISNVILDRLDQCLQKTKFILNPIVSYNRRGEQRMYVKTIRTTRKQHSLSCSPGYKDGNYQLQFPQQQRQDLQTNIIVLSAPTNVSSILKQRTPLSTAKSIKRKAKRLFKRSSKKVFFLSQGQTLV